MTEKISISGLKSLGWSDSMIRDLLPAPEERPNPHYRKAAPMKLWSRELVTSVMATNDYKVALSRISRRRSAALRVAKTKTELLMANALDMANAVTIRIISEEGLKQNTLSAKKIWYDYKGSWLCVSSVDDATMERWIVNYIRHNLVRYDESLTEFFGKVGKTSAYFVFKRRLLERIAEAYPLHASECYRQVAAMESMIGE